MDHGCMTVRVKPIVPDVGTTLAMVAGAVVATNARQPLVARTIAKPDAYDFQNYDASKAYDEILRKIMTMEQYNEFQ